MSTSLRVGVIADTHNLLRPEALEALRGCQRLLHLGDIGKPAILDALRQLAPLDVVRGNNDTEAWAEVISETLSLELGGLRLYLIHDLKQLAIDPRAEGFDVVLAGFSLHHFPTAAKAAVLADAARVLAPGGWLLWTDTYRREGETREEFLERLFAEIRSTWTAVTPAEREQFVAHIRDFDHPEPWSWMAARLEANGLSSPEVLYRDDFYVSLLARN